MEKRKTDETGAAGKAAGNEAIQVALACAMTMLGVATLFMTQSIFLEISQSFGIDIGRVHLAFGVASLSYAATFFVLGPATDMLHPPKLAVGGTTLLAATLIRASWTNDFNVFLLSMALTGIFTAAIPAAMFPHIAAISPRNKQAVYIGSLVAAGPMGIIFGRVAMGLMTAALGWQSSFRIYAGGLLFLAGVAWGVFSHKQRHSFGPIRNIFRVYANSMRIMVKPETASCLLIGFGLFFGTLGILTFLTYRLVAPPFNWTSAQVGWISFAGITALVAPFSGNLSRRIGAVKMILAGLSLCLAALQLMSWFDSTACITLGVLLLFLGVYICQPLLFLLMGQYVASTSLGAASSLYILFCVGGGSLSSFVLGPVWRSQGWPGIAVICSASMAFSLLIMTMRTLAVMKNAMRCEVIGAKQNRQYLKANGTAKEKKVKNEQFNFRSCYSALEDGSSEYRDSIEPVYPSIGSTNERQRIGCSNKCK